MRRLAVGVVVLLVLLVVGDRVAVRVADRVLASQLQSQLGTRPTVHVAGFPFLTQALRGRYDDVQVRAAHVPRGTVTVTSFRSSLQGVRVPLPDALRGDVRSVPVRHLTATGVVPYADIAAALGQRDLTLMPDASGLRLGGTVRVAGSPVAGSARVDVRLQGDELVLAPHDLQVGGVPISGALAEQVLGGLDLRVPLRGLPYGVRLSRVQAGPDGIVVAGAADDVVLRR